MSEKNVDIYFVEEVTRNTTPASPNFSYFRKLSGASLGLDIDTHISAEMSSDDEIQGVRHGNKKGGITLPFELTYNTFNLMFEGALRGAFSADTPSAGIDQLKAAITRKSFSILAFFSYLGAGKKRYHLYTGCEITQMSLTFPADGIISGSFTFFAQNKTASTSAPAGSVFGPSNGLEPFASKGGTIKEGGTTIAYATETTVSLENGVEGKFTYGSVVSGTPGSGQRNVTLNSSGFFDDESVDVLDKYEEETETSLDIAAVDPAGNALRFYFPAIKYTSGRPDISGTNLPISFPAQAYKDTTEGTSFIIEKTDAA